MFLSMSFAINSEFDFIFISFQGLERLVVTQSHALGARSQDQVTRLAVESIGDPNPAVLFQSLQLLLSCMYMG